MGVPAHYTYEIFMIRGNSKAYLFFGRFRLRGAEVMGFLANVNCSRSLYAIARPSVVCL